jgi:GntR family transcriptional repressor for pyruvate dehydrogenase complex
MRGGTEVTMAQQDERFPRISNIPAYQRVAEMIEQEIVSGRLRPGEALGTEAELVKQFGVNRSTVREGIRLLEQGGLIRRDPSRRLIVGLPHYDKLSTRVSRALILHQVSFLELWEATMAMSLATFELAMNRATPKLIERLERNIAATEAAKHDPAAVGELDGEFHILLEEASNNRVLQLAREPSNMLIYSVTELVVRDISQGAERLIQAHRMLVQALKDKDVELGRLWTRRHLNDWRKGFELGGRDLNQPLDSVLLDATRMRESASRSAAE